MVKTRLPERVFLTGFDLDESETELIKNIINKYLMKIERICDYSSLNIRLKKTKKGTRFLHEINAKIQVDRGIATTKRIDLNLFRGIRDVMERLIHELEHRTRK